jgi:hypothetical protein
VYADDAETKQPNAKYNKFSTIHGNKEKNYSR